MAGIEVGSGGNSEFIYALSGLGHCKCFSICKALKRYKVKEGVALRIQQDDERRARVKADVTRNLVLKGD